MRIVLVGPEIEENLGLRSIHATLAAAGHAASIVDFSRAAQIEPVARRLAEEQPDLVGLSMLYTARAREFIRLARRIRAAGFRGHLTAGGHFSSLNAPELLRDEPALDSVVHGEGEEGLLALAAGLDEPAAVAGVSFRDATGAVVRSGARPNPPDLDARPWSTRPERFHRYLGQPIANLLSSRGCYADCAFCSIHAWHRENGGSRFRLRAPDAVAREMAALYHGRWVRIFNFQDDNFFLPTAGANLQRFRALGRELAALGVHGIAIQAKGRPDSMDPDVLDVLLELGLFRLFLGVETDAVAGLRTLNRGIRREDNHRALALLRERELHVAFNLLLFDPDSTLATIRENVAFMAQQGYFPLNFCRTEVYAGTPLERRLAAEGRLRGSYLGRWYTIADPQAQAAFELFERVFTPRNFSAGGMHHVSMKVDYLFHLLRHFHPAQVDGALEARVKGLVGRLNADSATRMEAICAVVEAGPHAPAALEAEAARLSEGLAAFDVRAREEARQIEARIEALAREPERRPRSSLLPRVAAAAIALAAPACQPTHMCEMAPPPVEQVVDQAVAERIKAEFLQGHLVELERAMVGAGLYGLDATVWLWVAPGQAPVLQRLEISPESPQIRDLLAARLREPALSWLQQTGIASFQMRVESMTTHMCEMAPPPNWDDLPQPVPTQDLAPEEQERVRSGLWRDHGARLEELRALHGGGRVTLDAAIDVRGNAVEVALTVEPRQDDVVEGLLALLQASWPEVSRAGRVHLVLWEDRVIPVGPRDDTHMCEMAPPPMPPTPPPADAYLKPDEQELVRAALSRDYNGPLGLLHAQHEGGHAVMEATVAADGHPMVIAVRLEPQVQEVYRGLNDLLAKAHYEVPRMGKLSITLWDDTVPTIPEIDDTHMCEMAPAPIRPFMKK